MTTGDDEGCRQAVRYGDQQVERGHGGETHQIAAEGGPRLTTQQGTVVSDDQNTLRAGERGPGALEDFHFREKIFHLDHERIPERVVHAAGTGRADPDFHRRDLWDAITAGDFPEWELGLQLFGDDFADRFGFDILDPTKIVPEEEVPVRRVGRLVLDRVVDNFFAETEQVAFCTQNIIPGIDFTNDPLLRGRNFSHLDTQLKRLGGPNFTHLPVNAPKCPVAHFQQDGHMAMANPPGRVNYEPSSWDPPGPDRGQ